MDSQRFHVSTFTAHSELQQAECLSHFLISMQVARQSSTGRKLAAPPGGERWRNGQAARPRSRPVTCPQPAGNSEPLSPGTTGKHSRPARGQAKGALGEGGPLLSPRGMLAMCCDRAVTGPGRRAVSGLGACAVGVSMTRLTGPVRCFPACSLVEWSWAPCVDQQVFEGCPP